MALTETVLRFESFRTRIVHYNSPTKSLFRKVAEHFGNEDECRSLIGKLLGGDSPRASSYFSRSRRQNSYHWIAQEMLRTWFLQSSERSPKDFVTVLNVLKDIGKERAAEEFASSLMSRYGGFGCFVLALVEELDKDGVMCKDFAVRLLDGHCNSAEFFKNLHDPSNPRQAIALDVLHECCTLNPRICNPQHLLTVAADIGAEHLLEKLRPYYFEGVWLSFFSNLPISKIASEFNQEHLCISLVKYLGGSHQENAKDLVQAGHAKGSPYQMIAIEFLYAWVKQTSQEDLSSCDGHAIHTILIGAGMEKVARKFQTQLLGGQSARKRKCANPSPHGAQSDQHAAPNDLLWKIGQSFKDEGSCIRLAMHLLECDGTDYVNGHHGKTYETIAHQILCQWSEVNPLKMPSNGRRLFQALQAIEMFDVASKFESILTVGTGSTAASTLETLQERPASQNRRRQSTGDEPSAKRVCNATELSSQTSNNHIVQRDSDNRHKDGINLRSDNLPKPEQREMEKFKGGLFHDISKEFGEHGREILDRLLGPKDRRKHFRRSSGANVPSSREEVLVDGLVDWSENEARPTGRELYDVIFFATGGIPAVKKLLKPLELPEDYQPSPLLSLG